MSNSCLIPGIRDVEATSVFEGPRSKTPPRENFYSRSVSESQLKKLTEAKEIMKTFTKVKAETSTAKKEPTKTEKSTQSRKRKASFSSTSSSQSSRMSVYSEDESAGTSRRSSRSSSSSSSRSSSSGSSIYGTAPIHSGAEPAEESTKANLSDLSHSEYIVRK